MDRSNTAILTGALMKEFMTISAMIGIYCRDHHQSQGLCHECEELERYALMRLDRCPYGQNKPTCNKCPVHCYKPKQKEQIKRVMRYAGPRMLLKHPLLAVRHLVLERKPDVGKPVGNQSNRKLRKMEGA